MVTVQNNNFSLLQQNYMSPLSPLSGHAQDNMATVPQLSPSIASNEYEHTATHVDEQKCGRQARKITSDIAHDISVGFEDDGFFNANEWEIIVNNWPDENSIFDGTSDTTSQTSFDAMSVDSRPRPPSQQPPEQENIPAGDGMGSASAIPLVDSHQAETTASKPESQMFIAFYLPAAGTHNGQMQAADQFSVLGARDVMRGVTVERNGWKITL